MDNIEKGEKVAGVGSPSSSSEITLDLTKTGRNSKLVGTTVALINDLGINGEELGLGTVTEVITHNRWHEDSSFKGASDEDGILTGLSGELGDQRDAKIRIQASWSRANPSDSWIPGGTQLGMSPSTGTGVHMVSKPLVEEITATYSDLHYNGFLGGADDIPLPLNIPDNATPQGALHFGIFGRSGSGKALALNTPIPTPTGWTLMKDLKDGDIVFDERGKQCKVVKVHPTQHNKVCYKLTFTDGNSIVADAEHLWATSTHISSEIVNVPPHEVGSIENKNVTYHIRTTQDIFNTLKTLDGNPNHWLPPHDALQLDDIIENINFIEIEGEQSYLMILNVPSSVERYYKYLRASIKQRKALLQGILASRNINLDNPVIQYWGNSKTHALFVEKLAITLGYRPNVTKEPNDIQEDYTGDIHYFVSWKNPNFLQKVENKNYIENVELAPSEPVRCITVDSLNNMYLAGKTMIPTHNTAAAAYVLAGQMRHDKLGMVIIDPQGQWAAEHSLPFSTQGFAEELGRKVTVARVSEDLRLREDANLFRSLLDQTSFYNKLRVKHSQTQEIVGDEITTILNNIEKWSDIDTPELLRKILYELSSDTISGRIYTTDTPRERFLNTIESILTNTKELRTMMSQFQPILNLFQKVNSFGGTRDSLWGKLQEVFEREPGKPAPILIVDMSSRAPSQEEEMSQETESAYTILDQDGMKAAILRDLFASLKKASEGKFRNNENLNTLIVLDEAWRYAAPTNRSNNDESEITALSKDLAGYARDTRKFGISWFYISQSPKSINQEIWEQLHIFMFGTGLNGSDLDKATESYEDRIAALRLYKRFGNPIATGIWPFLLQGPVSPLMSANAPLTLEMYTDFDDFRKHNSSWIKKHRDILGKNIMTGMPLPPQGKMLKKGYVKKTPKNSEDAIAIVKKNQESKEFKKEIGLLDVESFTDPLAGF